MPDVPLHTPDFRPEAVLFDCDGTLLLTADLHYIAMSQAVQRQGGRMPRDWYMALTGLGRHDLFGRFAEEFGLVLDLPRLAADSIALTVGLAGEARENPPVARLARQVRDRLPSAVVTNSERPIAEALLAATGLSDLFDVILTVEDAARPKPAPDLYLLAARRLGVVPESCLVLEDSTQGLLAAEEAGMRCVDVREPGWPARLSHPMAKALAGTGAAR